MRREKKNVESVSHGGNGTLSARRYLVQRIRANQAEASLPARLAEEVSSHICKKVHADARSGKSFGERVERPKGDPEVFPNNSG